MTKYTLNPFQKYCIKNYGMIEREVIYVHKRRCNKFH